MSKVGRSLSGGEIGDAKIRIGSGSSTSPAAEVATAKSATSAAERAEPASVTSLRPSIRSEAPMPSLAGAVEWLNSKPLTSADLSGKVVLVDFWTLDLHLRQLAANASACPCLVGEVP
jgi:hypothetical protein